jgi:hypothetical protein
MKEEQNMCEHCQKEFNHILPTGLCSGCLNYEQHSQPKEPMKEEEPSIIQFTKDKMFVNGESVKDYKKPMKDNQTSEWGKEFRKWFSDFWKRRELEDCSEDMSAVQEELENKLKSLVSQAKEEERKKIKRWAMKTAECTCGCEFRDGCLCIERKEICDDLLKLLNSHDQ